MKQTSFCLFLFSMKCKHPIASAAGHHTFPTVLGFSLLLLVSYPVPSAVSSREPLYCLCIELSYFFLGEEMGGGSPERTGRRVETNAVLLCPALRLQLYTFIKCSVIEHYCVPRTGLSTVYTLVKLILTTVLNLWYYYLHFRTEETRA